MSEKKSAFKWLDKLKNVKHIEIYIAVIFVVILLLIYLSNFSSSDTKKNSANEKLTILEYTNNLEDNLESILSNIGGVENVKVMITLDMNNAEVMDSQIILNQFPQIKGVIVTAKGVEKTAIKLKVLHAIEAVLDITNGNIEILSSY